MATADQILDAADTYIRRRGFNSFSFRDIAADIGIKSASVHYHFPTKEALGAAAAKRYRERLASSLPDLADPTVDLADLIENYTTIYRNALVTDQMMCLCGLLAAEISSLPELVQDQVRIFFEQNINWLAALAGRLHPDLPSDDCISRARLLFASLQGALTWARATGQVQVFEDIAGQAVSAFVTR